MFTSPTVDHQSKHDEVNINTSASGRAICLIRGLGRHSFSISNQVLFQNPCLQDNGTFEA